MHENQPNHKDQPNVDPAVEMMFERFTAHVDACMKTLKRELKQELTSHFDPLHDDLAQQMATVEKRVDTVTNAVERGVVEIRKDTGITKVLATSAFAGEGASAPAPETPKPGDPRPIEIDRAVAADPAGGARRVDLPEYGAVVYPRPGSDASTAWAGAAAAISMGRGVR